MLHKNTPLPHQFCCKKFEGPKRDVALAAFSVKNEEEVPFFILFASAASKGRTTLSGGDLIN
jgi:hypothetical protein